MSDEYKRLHDRLSQAKRRKRFTRGLLMFSIIMLASYVIEIVRRLSN